MSSANAKVFEAVISPSAARRTTLSGVSSATTAQPMSSSSSSGRRASKRSRPPVAIRRARQPMPPATTTATYRARGCRSTAGVASQPPWGRPGRGARGSGSNRARAPDAPTTCGRASSAARGEWTPSSLDPLDAGAQALDHDGQKSQHRKHPIHACLHIYSFGHGESLWRSPPWGSSAAGPPERGCLDGCPRRRARSPLKLLAEGVDIARMLIGSALLVCILSVPLVGGRLSGLTELGFRHAWL